ncbi:NAD(P)-dependent oxidoreductase [Mycolicibacterium porcinum]|uniref:NAD(P)H-binding protein n=1 Tax=Mycolicibacterium porcinum TaxID=39693 RepID=A0AAW5T1R4_9MYCO|nr:NAD(P)H-binding protein [Mycolicibacterium porcinum]MCV7388080.1 NAD(P)H-binding protein [Mycolicibacterium porcinum]ORB43395.1 NmrA family transcriptional regulator [Mycolicibacterium porcinum]CDO31235.1 NAD-dependent epimerase/dehydratase [Mycolicibacterium vulneris]
MRYTVFGATGGIGSLIVDQLLSAGHDVTVYVRTPSKLGLTHERLTVIAGELSDHDGLRKAVNGADGVISALGPSLDRRVGGSALSDGTRAIVAAMQAGESRRLIGMATPSVKDPRDRPTLRGRLIPVMARVLFPNSLAEIIAMTKAITDSDLDWTVVRFIRPTDKPAKGTVRSGFLGVDKVGWTMTRADIAAFITAQLEDTRYIRALPLISN